MTSKFKVGEYAISTTNRAPLVRGQAYRVEQIIPAATLMGSEQLRLEGLPMVEPSSFFRPPTAGEAAMLRARLPLPDLEQFTQDDPERASVLSRLDPSGAPDSNPKTRFGMAKPPIGLIPGPAMVHMAEAFRDGTQKYGPANWRIDPVSASTYVNAALRHLLSWHDGEEEASDSGVHHLGHAAACLAILMDAQAQGTLIDDRPTTGTTASLIKERTRPLS